MLRFFFNSDNQQSKVIDHNARSRTPIKHLTLLVSLVSRILVKCTVTVDLRILFSLHTLTILGSQEYLLNILKQLRPFILQNLNIVGNEKLKLYFYQDPKPPLNRKCNIVGFIKPLQVFDQDCINLACSEC